MSLLKDILSGISSIFSGSPYRIILSAENKKFYLNAYKGAGVIPFAQVLNKYPQLGDLSAWVNYEKERAVIPLENLATVKKELSRLISEEQKNKPEIVIPQEIQQLKLGKMPAEFEIRYRWNDSERAILPQLRGEYWGEGTYVSENSYWSIPGFTENDDLWLRKNKIQGQEILKFFQVILPE